MLRALPLNTRLNVLSVVRAAAVSRQLLGKHVPASKNTQATIQLLLDTVILDDPCLDVITGTAWGN
jgi:hypothetical protein